ncbi:[Fe-Fe] hydrogenase large subunit C-terminal domain-containing protein [Desulfofalx alkaliphila]|uniref:[Fe-Fe] hydrogenase large subunit C-terminal domain-containing protein n=1 Tax=Desulfofalx alkaliphila TaxID=105483 RepID=UPI00068EA203|nr:[Fe-Fe] hydrogenase large subunit C-terminal domain-containing protein [Desulfofalx alkaliphila]
MRILYTNNDLCCNCYACVRACPVKAISFQNGKATISKEDCILCGSCVKVCSQGAKVIFDDTKTVQEWHSSGLKTVAIVAPSFSASFDCFPGQFISGLRQLGFSYVLEAAFGAEIHAHRLQDLLAKSDQTVISSACPSVVMLIEKHFPNLINYLSPLQSPMMITGQYAKKTFPQHKTVFIGPCIAKKAESVCGHAGDYIDAVITFRQLKQWFAEQKINLINQPANTHWDSPGANTARLLPLAGGLLKAVGLQSDVSSLDVIEASGPVKCKSILNSISGGFLTPVMVDMLCCDGCIAGPEIANKELCYNKSKKVITYTEEQRNSDSGYKYPADFTPLGPPMDTTRTFYNKQRVKKIFSDRQIWQVLRKTGKKKPKDLTNCGACGYSTCWEKAIAVLKGKAEYQMCLPYLLKQVKELNNSMAMMMIVSSTLDYMASTDSLTGLYNHRSFQQELGKQIKIFRYSNETFALFMIDIDNFKIVNDLYGHDVGDKVLLEVALVLKKIFKNGFVARYGGEEFAVIVPKVSATEALDLGNKLVDTVRNTKFNIFNDGSFIKLTVSAGISCYPINATNKGDLLKLADYSLYQAKIKKDRAVLYSSVLDEIPTEQQQGEVNTISTIKTLNIVINAKDRYTFKHSERVMYYAEVLGKKILLPEDKLKHLRYGAFLHDIGKIHVDMSVLLKPSRLSQEEYEAIKRHPLVGAEIARQIPDLSEAVDVILYHHERYDGKGYPYGLAGTQIPLLGRIVAIADSFDAMTTDRPYRKALSYAEAANELIKNSGSQFDPELVRHFICAIQSIAHINISKAN